MKILKKNQIITHTKHQTFGVMLVIIIVTMLLGIGNVYAEGENVASIGEKQYTDIKQAVKEAQAGETILLLEDIYVPKSNESVADFADNVTFDLNGHCISVDDMSFILQGDGLTIKNGSMEIANPENTSYALFIGDERTTSGVVIENITTFGGINAFNTEVTLKNVKASGYKYYSVWADENSTVNIESGTYSSDGVALVGLASKVNQYGPVIPGYMNIKGGTFIATDEKFTLGEDYYQPTIFGGNFNCDVEKYLAEGINISQNANGDYVTGYKIEVFNSDNTPVTINTEKVATAGSKVEIKYQVSEGYKLNSISVVDSNGNNITVNSDNTFIMPESNVTISATFTEVLTEVKVPVIDAAKPVEEVMIGIENTTATKEILMNTLETILNKDETLAEKVSHSDTLVEVEINNEVVVEEALKVKMETKAKEISENIKMADFFDILISVKTNNIKVGELTELDKPITLRIALPENLKNIEEGYARIFYIIREHGTEINVLETTLAEDGKYLIFESDKFSDFALAYLDKKIEEVEKPENSPNGPSNEPPVNVDTGSNITTNVIIFIISIIGICALVVNKKTYNSGKH